MRPKREAKKSRGGNILLKEILQHFKIRVELPEYLYNESFNDVFINGELSSENNEYLITAETRKDITHRLFIKPNEDYPIIIQSELKNGNKNGFKFGKTKEDHVFIGEEI